MAQSASKGMMNFHDPEAGMGKAPAHAAVMDEYKSDNADGNARENGVGNSTAASSAAVDKATSSQEGASAKKPSRWSQTFHVIYLALHLFWLHIHIRLFGQLYTSFLFGKWMANNRKIVVIGDDVAMGSGDWVTLGSSPGLQGRLNKVINKDMMTRFVGRGVMWTVFTAAKAGATSEDWLPVALMTNEQKLRFAARNGALKTTASANTSKDIASGTRKKGSISPPPPPSTIAQSPNSSTTMSVESITANDAITLRGASLFDKTFNPNVGTHKDADIVVICLGSRDKTTLLETVQNIEKLCNELIKLGKYVILTTIAMPPMMFAASKEALTRFRDRNEAMVTMITRLQAIEEQKEWERNGNYESPVIRKPKVAFEDEKEGIIRRGVGAGGKATAQAPVTVANDVAPSNAASYTSTTPVNSPRIVLARVAESLTKDHCYRFRGKTFNGRGYALATEIVLDSLAPVMRSIDGKRLNKRMD